MGLLQEPARYEQRDALDSAARGREAAEGVRTNPQRWPHLLRRQRWHLNGAEGHARRFQAIKLGLPHRAANTPRAPGQSTLAHAAGAERVHGEGNGTDARGREAASVREQIRSDTYRQEK